MPVGSTLSEDSTYTRTLSNVGWYLRALPSLLATYTPGEPSRPDSRSYVLQRGSLAMG